MKVTNLFHIVVLPLLAFASWKAYIDQPTYAGIYLILIGLAAVGFAFHTYKLTKAV